MTTPFIASYKFDLDFVFKVTRITENFLYWNVWKWHKLSSLGLEDFFSWLKIHLLKNYLTYINKISLTSGKVTSAIYKFLLQISMSIYNGLSQFALIFQENIFQHM